MVSTYAKEKVSFCKLVTFSSNEICRFYVFLCPLIIPCTKFFPRVVSLFKEEKLYFAFMKLLNFVFGSYTFLVCSASVSAIIPNSYIACCEA